MFAKVGDILELECNSGYEVKGAAESECARYGWKQEIGTCQEGLPGHNSAVHSLQSRFSYNECGVSDAYRGHAADASLYFTTSSEPNEFPWAVKLEIMYENQPDFKQCTGTLIHRRFVVTAAHCLSMGDLAGVLVYFGKYNMSINKEIGQERQLVNPSRIFFHPQFDFDRRVFDFALIELNTPVLFRRQIRPICLPDDLDFKCDGDIDNSSIESDFLRLNLTISVDSCSHFVSCGWGMTKSSRNSATSDTLKRFQLSFMSYNECQFRYRDADVAIGDTQICATPTAKNGPDTCEGDR